VAGGVDRGAAGTGCGSGTGDVVEAEDGERRDENVQN